MDCKRGSNGFSAKNHTDVRKVIMRQFNTRCLTHTYHIGCAGCAPKKIECLNCIYGNALELFKQVITVWMCVPCPSLQEILRWPKFPTFWANVWLHANWCWRWRGSYQNHHITLNSPSRARLIPPLAYRRHPMPFRQWNEPSWFKKIEWIQSSSGAFIEAVPMDTHCGLWPVYFSSSAFSNPSLSFFGPWNFLDLSVSGRPTTIIKEP